MSDYTKLFDGPVQVTSTPELKLSYVLKCMCGDKDHDLVFTYEGGLLSVEAALPVRHSFWFRAKTAFAYLRGRNVWDGGFDMVVYRDDLPPFCDYVDQVREATK